MARVVLRRNEGIHDAGAEVVAGRRAHDGQPGGTRIRKEARRFLVEPDGAADAAPEIEVWGTPARDQQDVALDLATLAARTAKTHDLEVAAALGSVERPPREEVRVSDGPRQGGLRPHIHDGRDLDACFPPHDRRRREVDPCAERDDAPPDRDAVPEEVGQARGRQHHTRSIVVRERDRPLSGPRR